MRGCEQYIELAALLADGELSVEEEAVLREHAASCPACQKRIAEYAAIHQALRDSSVTPPDTLTPGVMYKIRLEQGKPKAKRFLPRGFTLIAACAAAVILIVSANSDWFAGTPAPPGLSGGGVGDAAPESAPDEAPAGQPETGPEDMFDGRLESEPGDTVDEALGFGQNSTSGAQPTAEPSATLPSVGGADRDAGVQEEPPPLPAAAPPNSLPLESVLPDAAEYRLAFVAVLSPADDDSGMPELEYGVYAADDGLASYTAELSEHELLVLTTAFSGELLEGTGEKYMVVFVRET